MKLKLTTILLAALFTCTLLSPTTQAAGTASVKDFGATGDGITDDADAILAAFASDNDTIIFPEGEYLFNKKLTFRSGNKTVIGEKATLFTDDDYFTTEYPAAEEWAIYIHGVDNITLKGLHFQARQTEADPAYKAMIGVLNASDIHIDNCHISTVHNTSERVFNPIDFWGGWHNVSVTNSHIEVHSDNAGESGGGVSFRDIAGWGASGGKLINNTLYKFSHDEILWISESKATATVEDVEISGNRVYMSEPVLSPNVYTLGLNAAAPAQIRNIHIHDNEIIGAGTGYLIKLQGAENVDIHNNDLYLKVSPGSQGFAAVIGSDSLAIAPNATGTVQVHDNRTVSLDSNTDIAGAVVGDNPYDFINNHHVKINAPNASSIANNRGSFNSNNVTLNGNAFLSNGGGILSTNVKTAQDNRILINGFADVFIRHYAQNLTSPITLTGNHITTTKKITTQYPSSYTSLARMWSFAMNNHPITISGNTFINGSETESDESLETFAVTNTGSNTITDRTPTEPYSQLWTIQVTDAAPADQNASICNNTFQGFRTKRTPISTNPTIDIDCTTP